MQHSEITTPEAIFETGPETGPGMAPGTNHEIVPQIATALAANLTTDERTELDAAITPRIAALFAKAFGPQMWDILAPLTENDPTEDDPQAGGAEASGDTAAAEARLRELMRDPRYWRDRDPAFVARVAEGFNRLFPAKP